MDTVTLREFTIAVPTCVGADSLVFVWQMFQAGHERTVIVDSNHMPLGTFSLQQFIGFLSDQTEQEPSIVSDLSLSDSSNLLYARRGVPNLEIDLSGVQPCLGPSVQTIVSHHRVSAILPRLEPLIPLPLDWSVEQFHAALQAGFPQQTLSPPRSPQTIAHTHQAIPLQQWVLVNRDGQYVGILDRLRLLQVLASQTIAAPMGHGVGAAREVSTAREPGVDPAIGRSPSPPAGSTTALDEGHSEPTLPVVDPLIDLLERIPVPLMLQTGAGQIITQNLVWRQQVSGLRDPGQIGQAAAAILEAGNWETPDAGSLAGDGLFASGTATSLPYTNSCHISAEPGGCVCLCPMKSGQDRVWKFLKIPMGITSNQLRFEPDRIPAFPGEPPDQRSSPPPFKLANLGFSPDPDWRSIAQTEFLWLVLAQDITEQHQIAKELAAKNADLVQLNRLKDEFLACISHELKTPLTAVLGLSSLLKNRMLGELNDRQSRYAHLIYQSGRQLILIVNDILDLTRIETGQLELSPESVQIESVCRDAYQQAQQLHANEQTNDETDSEVPSLDFSLTVQPEVESLIADKMRLRQMLSNLLSNAIKFTAPGGAIGLTVESWEGWIAFNVWDTGIGIPTDKQHLIFQKFQQLENPLTRQFEGTGLGLVLTQRLARLHGGDVTFTSVEGEGSQFTLLLPPHPPHVAQDFNSGQTVAHPPSASITANNRLMLLVESDTALIEELSQPLVRFGYRVAIARAGTEALEKIRRLQPGIIFLNPMLPLLSGWDVLTLLKTDEETRHIPVVITAPRVDREQAFQNGANAFLNLPVQVEDLRRCLDRLVNQTSTPGSPQNTSPLTILYLHNAVPFTHTDSSHTIFPSPPIFANLQDLHNLLHSHRCRILEVDDLDQANLLAQVWKPNVVLLDGGFEEPSDYLKQLSLSPSLAALPLVTLTAEITYAANLIPGLAVFPCLDLSHRSPGDLSNQDSSALWQSIQMAAGIHWTPHVLVADIATLEAEWALAVPSDLHQHISSADDTPKHPSATQALVHYMQIAGFRSSVGHSWTEIVQQLEHHSVDLLLFCAPAARQMHPLFLEMFQTLEGLSPKPAILVWNCHTESVVPSPEEIQEFMERWSPIATTVLPTPLSMPELLARINQTLANR
ncbi:ATP-binding response regulator [Egbenema bharatensis]|uniref:ATP-binding response regulator n=1 Tax=Egbenema bharatensis TaxID=3463334 RepID=UPI003A8B1D38